MNIQPGLAYRPCRARFAAGAGWLAVVFVGVATLGPCFGPVAAAADLPVPGAFPADGAAGNVAPAAAGEPDASADSMMNDMTRLAQSFAQTGEEKKGCLTYRCQNVSGETVRKAVEDFLTPAGTVTTSDESDMIVITDVTNNLAILQTIIEAFDMPVPQVLVSVRVVEFSISSGFEKTINAEFMKFNGLNSVADSADDAESAASSAVSLPADSLAFVKRLTDNFVAPGVDPTKLRGQLSYMNYDADQQQLFSAYMKFLESKGHAEILSAPNLVLRRGAEGSIVTGQDVPIQSSTQSGGANTISTTFKSVGIKLRVTPTMVEGGKVRLLVSPEVSNVQEYTEDGAPLIAVRSASTELDMRDGQLVSIGGLLRREKRVSESRIPILSSIPLIGWLFRSNSSESVGSQLVIFLSVRILKDGEMNEDTIKSKEISGEAQKELDNMKQSLKDEPASLLRDAGKLLGN